MKARYRVLKKRSVNGEDLYYPQFRFLFWWTTLEFTSHSFVPCSTLEEAIEVIEKEFPDFDKHDIVWIK